MFQSVENSKLCNCAYFLFTLLVLQPFSNCDCVKAEIPYSFRLLFCVNFNQSV